MKIMYTRISQVVSDMSIVGDEYNENLAEEILGELADLLDVEDILENAVERGITRTRERIDDALAKARAAAEKQRELFEHVTGYDPSASSNELAINSDHVRAFATGMFDQLGIEIVMEHHGGLVWDIRIPEEIAEEL